MRYILKLNLLFKYLLFEFHSLNMGFGSSFKYHSLNNSYYFYDHFAGVLETQPHSINQSALTEVHSLVCHRHVLMYLCAIKSLLRYINDIGVVVHDDGTLTPSDKAVIENHLKGVRIIDHEYANSIMSEHLQQYPSALKFRNARVNMRQVFDYTKFAKSSKIIALDSDTLFLRKPKEILNWIQTDSNKILYAFEGNPYGPRIDGIPITTMKGIPFKFAERMCCGFVCFYRAMMKMDLIEEYCQYVLEKCSDRHFYAQTIYALCSIQPIFQPSILPSSYQNRLWFLPHPIFRHYWVNPWGWRQYSKDGKRLIVRS